MLASLYQRISISAFPLPTVSHRMFQFHSHQIFHCFVMAGAFVHYHGISQMAIYRLQHGECPVSPVDIGCIRNVTSSLSFMAGAADMASMQ